MTKNWSVSCENSVSILFLALANGMNNECRLPILLINPIRTFKSYVYRLEQVELYFCTDISLISVYAAIVISQLHIFHVFRFSDTAFDRS